MELHFKPAETIPEDPRVARCNRYTEVIEKFLESGLQIAVLDRETGISHETLMLALKRNAQRLKAPVQVIGRGRDVFLQRTSGEPGSGYHPAAVKAENILRRAFPGIPYGEIPVRPEELPSFRGCGRTIQVEITRLLREAGNPNFQPLDPEPSPPGWIKEIQRLAREAA